MSTTSPVVNTDSFLVGASVQELWTRHCIAFAAVYGLLGLLALSRLTVPSYRPVRGHPIAVQAMFVMLCVCRVGMFVLGAVIGHHQPYGDSPAPWKMAMAYDLVSTVGWAFFCAGVFAIGYSWSGRIPCIYCMLQFSDEPQPWKAAGLYLIPVLLTALSVVGLALRLVAAHLTERGESGIVNETLWVRATFVARASVASAVAFAGCFLIVLPYTAWMRARMRSRTRVDGIDHTAVAAMVREATFVDSTGGSEVGAVILLEVLGTMLFIESIYRLFLVQVTIKPHISHSWWRGSLALDVLLVMPEWIAVTIALLVDEQKLHNGQVDLHHNLSLSRKSLMVTREHKSISMPLGLSESPSRRPLNSWAD